MSIAAECIVVSCALRLAILVCVAHVCHVGALLQAAIRKTPQHPQLAVVGMVRLLPEFPDLQHLQQLQPPQILVRAITSQAVSFVRVGCIVCIVCYCVLKAPIVQCIVAGSSRSGTTDATTKPAPAFPLAAMERRGHSGFSLVIYCVS